MPLFFFEKAEAFYTMVLHATFNPDRVVLMTPGEGTFVVEAVRQRTSVICIVANEKQKDILLANVKKRLHARVANANDRRFYRPPSLTPTTSSVALTTSEAPSPSPAPATASVAPSPSPSLPPPPRAPEETATTEAQKTKTTVESDDEDENGSSSGSSSKGS